ncbi:MAG: histidine phosphatase family protein [Mycolicibacterium insubricum]
MSSLTTVHVMRHGEVHNPDQILYGRLPGYRLSDRGRGRGRGGRAVAGRQRRHLRGGLLLQRAQETAAPIAAAHSLEVSSDPELIESLNIFEGKKVSPGDGALRDPRNWKYLVNPLRPSWGEPYVQVAARMRGAVERARIVGAGHEVVCVSHQLPVETVRRALTGSRLAHFPTRRMCNLASLTSFYFDDDRLVGWGYAEPAGR